MTIDKIVKGFIGGRYIVSKNNDDDKVKEQLNKFENSPLPVQISYLLGIASKKPVGLAIGLYKAYTEK